MSPDTNLIPSSGNSPRSGGRLSRPAKAAAFDTRLGLHALRRRWLLVSVLGVVVAAIAAACVWFFLPPGKQTAARTLQVSSVAPWLAFDAKEKSVDFETFKRNQMSLIRSKIVLNAALRSPKAANLVLLSDIPQPLEWFEKELRVNFAAGPEIMQISLQGSADQMKDLAALVDAIAAAYMSEVVDKEAQKHLVRLALLRDIATRYDKKLKSIRLSMRKLREDVGTGDRENMILRQQMATREYEQVSQELTRRRSEIRSMKTLLTQIESGKADGFSVSMEEVDAALDTDPRLTEHLAQIAQLERKVEREASIAALGHAEPLVQRIQKDLDSKRADSKAKRESLKKSIVARLKVAKASEASTGLASLKFKLTHMENLAKVEEKDSERLSAMAKRLNIKALDLEDFASEIEQAQSMVQFLNKKAETMAVEEEAPARIVKLEEEAYIIRPNEQVRKAQFSGLAGVAGLALVAVSVVFFEMKSRRLASSTEVADQLGMYVVANLPYYKGNKRSLGVEQQLKEAIDSARTMLLHASETGKLKIVLVASPVAGEGKTSLSCHLAASLARAGRRIILIDGDLRKPDAHRVFAAPPLPGVCEVLRGECPLDEALYETGLPGLRMLAAGRVDERALSAIAQTGFASIADYLRTQADFVIVDSSPILAVPDALMLAKHVDGVLFATMRDETRLHWLSRANEKMTQVGARVLGVVVNGARDIEQAAYTNYKYHRGSTPQTAGK